MVGVLFDFRKVKKLDFHIPKQNFHAKQKSDGINDYESTIIRSWRVKFWYMCNVNFHDGRFGRQKL